MHLHPSGKQSHNPLNPNQHLIYGYRCTTAKVVNSIMSNIIIKLDIKHLQHLYLFNIFFKVMENLSVTMYIAKPF